MSWPERIDAGVGSLDFMALSGLSFEAPDLQRFPCLTLAFDALAAGGAAPAVLNAANEVAVAAFLDGRIGFLDIARVVADTLAGVSLSASPDLDSLLQRDAEARAFARSCIVT
jgi:1-deoxy-D-xylulose-5-phosphate reductoisomerase